MKYEEIVKLALDEATKELKYLQAILYQKGEKTLYTTDGTLEMIAKAQLMMNVKTKLTVIHGGKKWTH